MQLNLTNIEICGAVAASFFLIKLFDRRAADAPPLVNASLPVALKYDAWQTAPILAVALYGAGVAIYAISVVTPMFLKSLRQHIDPTIILLPVFGAALVAVMLCLLWFLLFKMIYPDRLCISTDGITLYSLGTTRQWTWPQISGVELKTVQESRGGSHQIVCLTVPAEEKPNVPLPRFMRSTAGPEEEQAIYDLIRSTLSKKDARHFGVQSAIIR
jgi:hypothetical protein